MREGARKLARSAGASPVQVRPSKPPGGECCVRRRRRRTRSVHSCCVGCGSEPRNDELAGAETVFEGQNLAVLSNGRRGRSVNEWTWFKYTDGRLQRRNYRSGSTRHVRSGRHQAILVSGRDALNSLLPVNRAFARLEASRPRDKRRASLRFPSSLPSCSPYPAKVRNESLRRAHRVMAYRPVTRPTFSLPRRVAILSRVGALA
jgi:hypothetical protein